jgi:hypothetical protein
MLSEECISGFFPISLKTKSGLLWFPTQEGIVVVDPRHPSINAPAPAVVLEETLVDGVPDAADSLRLAPGKHRLEFRYTGINFDAPSGCASAIGWKDWIPIGWKPAQPRRPL